MKHEAKESVGGNRTQEGQTLGDCVRHSMTTYFAELNGHPPADLYELVLSQIEQPLLKVVMQQTRGNITRAAEILGLNRATLRKKLQKYAID